jgi:hypothetical protein
MSLPLDASRTICWSFRLNMGSSSDDLDASILAKTYLLGRTGMGIAGDQGLFRWLERLR